MCGTDSRTYACTTAYVPVTVRAMNAIAFFRRTERDKNSTARALPRCEALEHAVAFVWCFAPRSWCANINHQRISCAFISDVSFCKMNTKH